MKDKAIGTLLFMLIAMLIIGMVTAYSFGYFGGVQDSIVDHYKKTENY